MRVVVLLVAFAAACSRAPAPAGKISGERILEHVRVLSSDKFEGRAPGGRGEQLTLDYLESRVREIGLAPAAPGGGFRQPVPLVGLAPAGDPTLAIEDTKGTLSARAREDFVAWSRQTAPETTAEGAILFAGHGVQAPELQWDDFAGVDPRGKVLVVLVGDPPLDEEGAFGGRAMTYYGRWSYKFEKALELGAAGCLVVHDTEAAGYPWSVVAEGWSGEQFDVAGKGAELPFQGWITTDFATKLFARAGLDFASLRKAAGRRGFRAAELLAKARATIRHATRTIESSNLVVRLPGADAALAEEHVIMTAHWDHLGVGPNGVYHGAIDNASGVAVMLEVARALATGERKPRRSVVFVATAAEEQNLLGARHYVATPALPLARAAAVINLDGINMLGRTRDVVMIGRGSSSLDEVVERAAAAQSRVVAGDPEPEKGFFYRSDHLPFLQAGVPAFYPHPGVEVRDRPEGWGLEQRRRYIANDYHKPSDVVRDDWDPAGAVEDAELYVAVARAIVDAEQAPEWKPGSEFRAAGERRLGR